MEEADGFFSLPAADGGLSHDFGLVFLQQLP